MEVIKTSDSIRFRLQSSRKGRDVSGRIRKALDEALDLARSEGFPNPVLFFEAEGSVHIMDADHEGWINGANLPAGQRQRAIIFTLYDSTPPRSDVGAW